MLRIQLRAQAEGRARRFCCQRHEVRPALSRTSSPSLAGRSAPSIKEGQLSSVRRDKWQVRSGFSGCLNFGRVRE